MKRLLQVAAVVAACGITASIIQAQNTHSAPNNLLDRFVLDGNEAVTVLPPELIAAPTIKNVYLAPDGANLIVLRETMKITPELLLNVPVSPPKLPQGEQELIYWNVRTRTARSFWKSPLFTADIRDVVWLPQTETAFVVLHSTPLPIPPPAPDAPPFKPEWKVLKMTAGQVRATELPLPDLGHEGYVSLSSSAKLPLVLLYLRQETGETDPDGRENAKSSAYLIRRDGRTDARIALPETNDVQYISPDWDKDGKPAFYVMRLGGADKQRVRQHYAVDTKTLALTLLKDKFERQAYETQDHTRAGVLALKPQKLTANVEGMQKPIPTLWLESTVVSEFPRVLLAGDAVEGKLLPKGNGAVYQSQGALWYTPFLRLNQAQFLAARLAALRQKALSDARQAGTALMMYAQDYDEMFPDGEGIKDKVMPYLKNEDILSGFVYTFEGGELKNIEKPAETLIGYLPGPGGRANIYADGHVQWGDDPKP